MPRRSLFCARAPTGLVHWYQSRLVGAHLRPRVRTRRSTERGGGRHSGKSAQLAMFRMTPRGCFRLTPNRAQPSKRVCFLYNRKRLYRSPPSVRACQGGGGVQNKQKGCKTAETVISKICTNCRFGILSEFLGVNVQVSERFGACPPLFTGCGKATHNITYIRPCTIGTTVRDFLHKTRHRTAHAQHSTCGKVSHFKATTLRSSPSRWYSCPAGARVPRPKPPPIPPSVPNTDGLAAVSRQTPRCPSRGTAMRFNLVRLQLVSLLPLV